MNKLKVSIIVPIFNCEEYISNCLDSILSQTYKNIEVIVINDGSTDSSECIVKKYQKKDSRILYFYQNNKGPSAARNKGIVKSSGKYIAFVDSDDTISTKFIELLLNEIETKNADIVCCGYLDISEYGLVKHTDFPVENKTTILSFVNMICKGTGGVLWGKIFKREIISINNIKMDESLFMSEDLIFVLQYISHCKKFSSTSQYLYHYNRLNLNSISSNISIDYIRNFVTVCRYMEKILLSLNLSEKCIERIISKKVQDFVLNLIELQSKKVIIIGIKKAINNAKKVINVNYFKEYKDNFKTNKLFYKPYIFFLKKDFIRTMIIYGLFLNTMKIIRKKWLSRKRVRI